MIHSIPDFIKIMLTLVCAYFCGRNDEKWGTYIYPVALVIFAIVFLVIYVVKDGAL